MEHITKEFGSFKANDDITLKLKKGEIHALLGENGAGKSTLMSVLFGLYQPEQGTIRMNGKPVTINNPNDANALGIGMVHQHFKLVHNFTVLESIVLGHESVKHRFLKMDEARKKVVELSERYKFKIDPDALISDITVGMQQRVEILKMLYCDNDVLIFDEPTAVLTPQEIDELMKVMKQLVSEGKSILFITHKLAEIKAVADRCTVLRKGRCIGTIDVAGASKEEMSEMMVGRKVDFVVEKKEMKPLGTALSVRDMTIRSKRTGKNVVDHVSFEVKKGEIVCIAGIDGNGQSELVYGITGLMGIDEGQVFLNGKDITKESIRRKCLDGVAHIPEDRHKHGMVLDYTLKENLILQNYYTPQFDKHGFLRFDEIDKYAEKLIERYDIRSAHGAESIARGMSGGNQQKAVIARELDRNPEIVIAVQPVRGLDVGAIEYIHRQIIAQRDAGKAVLLVSFELDEVMNVSDRILVMYEGKIVADVKPEDVTIQELGLYMAGTGKGDAAC
ncbi:MULTISPECIES: ABC transporter ATP-binding protein [Blautia]|uniref:ABC transporter ATP-binding protein n=2 Tax=Blautia TaxID=572511 RepID=A0ABR7FCX1_9FIRM|nr:MULTISPECIES: ABC transporter ATP-binding protein [Blautia]POP38833.1 heme ABC transporter ATP-binding protein [Blautia producta]RHP83626.1 ABC transporter ATP-binding protein [Blautia sp. OF01-4LB]MBC5673064.1 ABC transporter ATP-binding protein [Blautia celeris]MCB4354578.1 ABC transporter ATP-binding protein [Blautia sp. RD014232]MCJ8017627.1 ABC transporter ATP-binding protein [Blautia sp. NSJ-159]